MNAFRAVRNDFTKEMVDAKDDDKVLQGHARLKALEALLKKLHYYLEDGGVARQEIEWIEKTRKK